MISIIICSVNTSYLEQVKKSISASIGVEYELLVWDNSTEKKGICEVYNMMAFKANYDYLCFLHEDILFETDNWGQTLCSIFQHNNEIGIIGVAGSKYKSEYYSGWYTGIKELDCVNIIHRYVDRDEHQLLQPAPQKVLEEVVCIDGVFIACRKKIWETIPFNEKELSGFHFYDIDLSLRANVICTVAVTFEILLVHITKGGDYGDNWVNAAIQFHENSRLKLPVSLLEAVPAETDSIVINSWLNFLKNYSISFSNKVRWVRKQKLFGKSKIFYSLLKFFIYKPLRLDLIHHSKKKK